MESSLAVEIGQAGATLRVEEPAPEQVGQSITVSIEQPGIAVSTRVYLDSDGGGGLVEFFRSLADDWRGWDGPRKWSTLEGDFQLTCVHNGIGRILVHAELGLDPWESGWKVTAVVVVDPGALQGIATALHHLLANP